MPNKKRTTRDSLRFKARKNVRVITIAENMLTTIPSPKVSAKPLIRLEPNQYKITEVIKLDTFESRMESHARIKPSSIAKPSVLPARNSSFMRSNIKMLASTAIPMERINPAVPAAERVTGRSLKIARVSTVYSKSATTAKKPGKRYHKIINSAT